MKEYPNIKIVDQVINDIVSELPLKERISFANMNKEDVDILQGVFDWYIRSKIDFESEDEYTVIMKALWEKLQDTHKLRVLK